MVHSCLGARRPVASKARDKFVQLATEALPLVLDGASAGFVRILVFCETPKQASEVAAFLAERGWPASTKPSEEVGKLEIVCVTDGSGRGVDWKDVRGVVNFNAPGDVQTFLHRAGRLQAVRESPPAAVASARVCGVLVTLVTTETPEERRMEEVRKFLGEAEGEKMHSLFSTRRSFRNKLREESSQH
jgi:superfamily II DNA/RNA helicase